LPREQVQLAEEAARALAGDLVPGPVEDRRLALEDDDERIARVTDPEQELSLRGRALLAPRRESLKLPRGQDGTERARHPGHASEGTARPAEPYPEPLVQGDVPLKLGTRPAIERR
jgi:hypothetical protein